MKRVVVLTDIHAGHHAGLCTNEWLRPKSSSIGKLQRELRKHYDGWVSDYYEPDVLLFLGDGIEGKGTRSGSTELLTADREFQVEMATELIQMWNAKKIVMAYGTPSHTGVNEDWERIIATNLGAEIHGQVFVTVEDVTFHIKHKIGSSSIPHGRHTATSKERLWLAIWEEEQDWPKADIILRGHVHYHQFCGSAQWLGMTCPALQAARSKYGSRQCSGIVHFGITVFDIDGDEYDWHTEIVKIKESKPTHIVVK